MEKPKYNKVLPSLPSSRSPPRPKIFSEDTYTKLLEEENEQLRLLTKELQKDLRALESKYNIEMECKRKSVEKAIRYDEEIKCRDRLVADIACTIVNKFQNYKDTFKGTEEDITVYSNFESASPI